MKVDVHILVYPTSPTKWLDQCLESLNNEPINIHIIDVKDSRYESIGNYRIEGFSKGEEDYVSYVDADDYILPKAFSKALPMLAKHLPNYACTWERVYKEDTKKFLRTNKFNHHLKFYKRSFIKNFFDTYKNNGAEGDPIVQTLLKDTAFDLGYVGYVWRVHDYGWHNAINRNNLVKKNRNTKNA